MGRRKRTTRTRVATNTNGEAAASTNVAAVTPLVAWSRELVRRRGDEKEEGEREEREHKRNMETFARGQSTRRKLLAIVSAENRLLGAKILHRRAIVQRRKPLEGALFQTYWPRPADARRMAFARNLNVAACFRDMVETAARTRGELNDRRAGRRLPRGRIGAIEWVAEAGARLGERVATPKQLDEALQRRERLLLPFRRATARIDSLHEKMAVEVRCLGDQRRADSESTWEACEWVMDHFAALSRQLQQKRQTGEHGHRHPLFGAMRDVVESVRASACDRVLTTDEKRQKVLTRLERFRSAMRLDEMVKLYRTWQREAEEARDALGLVRGLESRLKLCRYAADAADAETTKPTDCCRWATDENCRERAIAALAKFGRGGK